MTPARLVIPLLAALALPLGFGCGAGCPDLALLAMDLALEGVTDSELRVSASTGDGAVLTSAPLDELYGVGAGSYDLVFTRDGTEVGSLDGVCTVGSLTGCAAQDAPASDTPEISIVADGSVVSVTLLSNGSCP